MELVPIALACGHLVDDWATFEIPATDENDVARCECPHGCGMQEFVAEPHEGEMHCLCQPGRHVCGQVTTVVVDLGEGE